MKVKIGKKIIDAEDEPIMLIFKDEKERKTGPSQCTETKILASKVKPIIKNKVEFMLNKS